MKIKFANIILIIMNKYLFEIYALTVNRKKKLKSVESFGRHQT